MRLPFPEKISYSSTLTFAVLLGGVQLLQGTRPYFTGLCILFILLGVAAFNIAGGMNYPSGAFIGSHMVFTLLLPLVVKAALGESADSRLRAPIRTVEVYVVGIIGMLVAAVAVRYLRPKKAMLDRIAPITNLRAAYYGVSLLALIITPLLMFVLGRDEGSLGAFLNQVNRFFPILAFLLGVAYTIKRTNGAKSVSAPLALGIVMTSFVVGLLSFSKEAFLTPLMCWVLMMAVLRFRVRAIHAIVFSVVGYLIYAYMVPYAAIGRNFDPDGRSPVQVSVYLLSHMNDVRAEFESQFADPDEGLFYYGTRLGLLDRMEFVSTDSALIEETDRVGTYGYQPIYGALSNFVPHIFWKDKPLGRYGNAYAHDIRVLSDDDVTTGVSFSPTADAYHEGGMFAVISLEPVVMLLGFLMLDSVIGDVRRNFVGLAVTALLLRVSSEGLLFGVVAVGAQPLFAVVLAALLCAHVFPILGAMIGTGGAAGRIETAPPAPEALHGA